MNAYLSDELYKTITDNTPVICTDIIPVRKKDDAFEVGMILRATGSQTGKWTILGGRIYHSETVDAAVARHLETDLGITDFTYFSGLSAEQPFHVQQYFMESDLESDRYCFDPSKHAVALTYLVEIDEASIAPRHEAADFIWIADGIKDMHKTGYNQHIVINQVLRRLNPGT